MAGAGPGGRPAPQGIQAVQVRLKVRPSGPRAPGPPIDSHAGRTFRHFLREEVTVLLNFMVPCPPAIG
jgi:hypothetical protein